ncbi:MAG: restriction endonuclease subunit S [Caldilineaceae bacterium]
MKSNEIREWSVTTLGQCATWYSGGTPDTTNGDYWGGEIPWITASSLHDFYLFDSERKVTPLGVENGTRLMPENTIIFVVRGMSLKSEFRVGIARRPMTFGQDCKAIIAKEGVDPLFLANAIRAKAPEILELVDEASHGTGRLQTEAIQGVEILLPPLPEQRAIASILGALDDKIELNRQMNRTLEAMAQALFKSWFVDFDPVRAKADGRETGLPEEVAALFPDRLVESELGEIPEGWSFSELPNEIDFLEGPGLRNWQYKDEGMKFLNIRCIVDGDLDMGKANSIALDEFEKSYSHFALKADDIVISTSGTLGRIAIVRPDHLPLMLNTSIIRMRGKTPIGMTFVWNYLQSESFLTEMFALAAGSVQLNFGPVHLRKIVLLRPPSTILTVFEEFTQPFIRKALLNRMHARTSLRDTLLPKLISGEVRLGMWKDLYKPEVLRVRLAVLNTAIHP